MACSDKLTALIQAPENLNFLVFITRISTAMGQESNSNPSPIGRQITSSTSTKDDKITITGWVRCLQCGVNTIDVTDIVPRLKRMIERQKYTVNDFITIITPYEEATNMLLENATVDRQGETPQELMVTMSFKSANFSGEIVDPNFSIGGVQG